MPERDTRVRVVAAVKRLWEAAGPLSAERKTRLARIEKILGLTKSAAKPKAPRVLVAKKKTPARGRRPTV